MISILVPTYNGEQFVRECLGSALAQTMAGVRVIVGDDNSTDDTLAVCRDVARADSRVEVHPSPVRLGWARNVNRLLGLVEEDLFAILPQDDLLAPDYLEKIAVVLDRDAGAACAYSDVEGFGAKRSILGLEPWHGDRITRVQALASETPTGLPWRGVTRRSVLDSGIRLRPGPHGSFHADALWALEVLAVGRYRRVAEPLYRKRYRPGSMLGSWDGIPDPGSAWVDHTIAATAGLRPRFGRRGRRTTGAALLDRLVRLLGLVDPQRTPELVARAARSGGARWRRVPRWARARVDQAHALGHHRDGRLDDAEGAARDALRRDRSHAEAWLLLARILADRGRAAEAARRAETGVALQPWSRTIRLQAASVMRRIGAIDRAVAHAEAATRLGLVLPGTWIRLARLRLVLGDRDGAVAAVREAERLGSDGQTLRRLRARLGVK